MVENVTSGIDRLAAESDLADQKGIQLKQPTPAETPEAETPSETPEEE